MVAIALRQDVLNYVRKHEPVEPEDMIGDLFPGAYCGECGHLVDKDAEKKVFAAIKDLMKKRQVSWNINFELVLEK